MPEDLLNRIRREISERKQAAHAAHDESRRLEAALAALQAGTSELGTSTVDRGRGSPRRRRSSGAASRAPRGQNRRRLLEAVADRPGATVGQLAEVTGVKRATA